MRLVSFRPRPSSPRSSPTIATARRLVVIGLLALLAPVSALAAEPAARRAEAERSASKSLDFYFAALAAAPDDLSAARARGRIEAHWAASGSATAELLGARAAVALDAGDRALALDLLDAAVVVAPAWADARHRRALVHLAGHDTARADADLAEVLRLEPRHIGAMNTRATLLEATGRKAEALKWLRRLATFDPRNPALASGRLDRLIIEVEGREL